MFSIEQIKEIAKNDENFAENAENWEELFKLIEKGGENGEDYKAKYEALKEKYIARFETPVETNNVKTEKDEDEDVEEKNIKIEDIIE